jgi:hypothetical protein
MVRSQSTLFRVGIVFEISEIIYFMSKLVKHNWKRCRITAALSPTKNLKGNVANNPLNAFQRPLLSIIAFLFEGIKNNSNGNFYKM